MCKAAHTVLWLVGFTHLFIGLIDANLIFPLSFLCSQEIPILNKHSCKKLGFLGCSDEMKHN